MLFSCAVGLSMICPTRPGVGYSDHHLFPDFLSAAHARNTAIKRINNDARIIHILFFPSGIFTIQNTCQFLVGQRDPPVAIRTAIDGQRAGHVHGDWLELFNFPESTAQAISPYRRRMITVSEAPRGPVDSPAEISLVFGFLSAHVSPMDKNSGCQTPARFLG